MDILPRLHLPRAVKRYSTVVMFVAGVLFDFLTIQRIDAWTDLALQVGYLSAVATLLVQQQRQAAGVWTPGPRLVRWWEHNVEALHFLYGGLLSAAVVLYVRSSALARPAVFLVLLVAVLVMNELPAIRRTGYPMRLGLFGFCVLSFLNYFVPIMVGHIGPGVFASSLVLAVGPVWILTRWLTEGQPDRTAAQWRLFAPAALVFLCVGTLYWLRLIPPVPLSVQFQGVYHDVRREGDVYTLVYVRPHDRLFWRHDSRPFLRREGDRLHYFARIFAPAGFTHQVTLRWEVFDYAQKAWVTTDRIPLGVTGGRAAGYRGTAVKTNFWAGHWRVTAETEDGRAIASLSFDVEDDKGTNDRPWLMLRSALPEGKQDMWSRQRVLVPDEAGHFRRV